MREERTAEKPSDGGDGFAAAGHLARSDCKLSVLLCCGEPKTPLAAAEYSKLCNMRQNVEILRADTDKKVVSEKFCGRCTDIIADCVFGTGFHGEIDGTAAEMISLANNTPAYKIACDVPSGVNSLNGQTSDTVFHADETVTFHAAKCGTAFSPAKEMCGNVIPVDIGIPWENYREKYADILITEPDAADVFKRMPKRPDNSYKGTFGKVTLVCGSEKYPGAAVISAMSALRSGAGLVELCAPQRIINAAVSVIPECILTTLDTNADGYINAENIPKILKTLEKSNAAVIGCGMGVCPDTEEIVQKIVQHSKCPLVIDADGINCLSLHIDVLKEKQTQIILTPHMGELARLCRIPTDSVLGDPLGYAYSMAREFGVTVHAKNVQSLTVSGNCCEISDFGCSALAKGGSGDMLAGLIGGFTAQGLDSVSACVCADRLIGSSAKMLCRDSWAGSLTATDIIRGFGSAIQSYRNMV